MTATELFDLHFEWAAQIARNVARKLPPSFDAGDLIQEAHIEHWKRCQMYDPAKSDNYQGYAYLPIRGACLMSVRRRAYRDSTGEPLGVRVASALPEPEEQLIRRHEERKARQRLLRRGRRLRSLMQGLDASANYLVNRVAIDGVPLQELATIWKLPRSEFTRRLTAAVRKLKRAKADR